jgi:hypothetical protein
MITTAAILVEIWFLLTSRLGRVVRCLKNLNGYCLSIETFFPTLSQKKALFYFLLR